MGHPIMKYLFLLAGLLVAACSTTRTVVIDSSRTARIDDAGAGCMICEQTPCTFTFTHKPFRIYDSSQRFTVIKAVIADGRCKQTVFPYREVKDGEVFFFDFADGTAETDPLEMFLRRKGIKRKPCKK